MAEKTQTLPNFANRPQLDKHPTSLNPEVAQKDSPLNQDLSQCAQWLRNNKDKAGSEEYMSQWNALESMAEKGYPMAEFEFAKFLQDLGEFNRAAIYFDKAKNNENADSQLKKEIHAATSDKQNSDDKKKQGKNQDKENTNNNKTKSSNIQEKLANHAHEERSAAFVEAYNQAKIITAQNQRNEGYLSHHSWTPPQSDDN